MGKAPLSLDAVQIFLVTATGLLLINLIPCFAVDFYEDDYRHFWILSGWNWDLKKALRPEGIEQGFRPLLYRAPSGALEPVGESVVAQRAIQAGVYLLIALTLARMAWRLGGRRFTARSRCSSTSPPHPAHHLQLRRDQPGVEPERKD